MSRLWEGTAEKGRGGRGTDGREVSCLQHHNKEGRKEDGTLRVKKGPDYSMQVCDLLGQGRNMSHHKVTDN